jgi:aspartate/methionine/tyrosine aminotransferase
MYVMAKLPGLQDDQAFARALVRDHGIAVIPGSFCGFPGWIRVCYANLPPDECIQAAGRLEKGIRSILPVKKKEA